MPDAFQEALAQAVRAVETRLDQLLPPAAYSPVTAAMRHAALLGGKRLRAFLVIESAKIFEASPSAALTAASAIECIHAYSLVHDDLPAMDDDSLRRGQPTVHVKWDEATAILTGDALQSFAFELLASPEMGPAALPLIRSLAEASGGLGMVDGQMRDILAEKAHMPLSFEEISFLQSRKTGALIEWSAVAGATLAGADDTHMRDYARSIGLAFQIHDDVLDVEGNEVITGKKLRKDVTLGKATFVTLLGLEEAKTRARLLVEEASDALSPLGNRAENLRHLAKFIITRQS